MLSRKNDRPYALDLSAPWPVVLALGVYLASQVLALTHLHGVTDQFGFGLNTSKLFAANTFEEDGAINVFASMGYFTDFSNRFAYYINIGGPFIHLSRLYMLLAEAFGFVTRFPDPWIYLWHPQALAGAWQAFGVYKLIFFLPLAPLAVYWLMANHVSRIAGILAVWLYTSMPFLMGFELRMKVDTPAITFALFSILCLLQWVRHARSLHFLLASLWLGLSLSMKLIAVPVAVLFLPAMVARYRSRDIQDTSWARLAAIGLVLCVTAFVVGNPYVIPGLSTYVFALRESTVFLSISDSSPTSLEGSEALWWRLTHLDVFFGPIGNIVALPCLGWTAWQSTRRGFYLDGTTALLACLVVTIAYLLAVAWKLMSLGYYFYFPAVLILMIISAALAATYEWLKCLTRPVALAGWIATAALIISSMAVQGKVYSYLIGPTNREAAHAWVARNVHTGASIGVWLPGQDDLVNSFYRIDPFRYRVVAVGVYGESLSRIRPDYSIAAGTHPGELPASPEGYELVAAFDRGNGIHRELHCLFQEEPFVVFKRCGPAPAIDHLLLGGMEAVLGGFLGKDTEPAFNILQFQSLGLFPISLNVLRKEQRTVLPLPPRLLQTSARHASSPLAYVHQIDSATLTLWGVKYLLASLDPEAGFTRDTLGSGRFVLVEHTRFQTFVQGKSKEVGLFYNQGYQGQAFFVASPSPGEDTRLESSGLFLQRPVPGFGRFYDRPELKKLQAGLLEIRLSLDTDGPVDVVFKGAKSRRSLLVDKGSHDLVATYEIDGATEEVGYEINPVRPGVKFKLRRISAAPLRITTQPVISSSSVSMTSCFVRVQAPTEGRVIMAVPYHPLWTTTVDGRPTKVERGPADTVAVRVLPGDHLVSVTCYAGGSP